MLQRSSWQRFFAGLAMYSASSDLLNSVRSRKWSSIQYCVGSGQNRTIQGRTMSWSTTGIAQQWLRNKGKKEETMLIFFLSLFNIWFIHPISSAYLSMGYGSSGFSRVSQAFFFFFWVNSLLLESKLGFCMGFLQWILALPSWSSQLDIARTLASGPIMIGYLTNLVDILDNRVPIIYGWPLRQTGRFLCLQLLTVGDTQSLVFFP